MEKVLVIEDLIAYGVDICADDADDQHFLPVVLHDSSTSISHKNRGMANTSV